MDEQNKYVEAKGTLKNRWYVIFSRRFLVTREFKVFGYRPVGNYIDETDHGEKIKITVNSSGTVHAEKYHDIDELKYAQFVRHEAYVTNFWFRFLEKLMRIFSFIRVNLSCIILPNIGFVFGSDSAFDRFFQARAWQERLAMDHNSVLILCIPIWIASVFLALYGPSLLIMLLGYLTRKLCKLDERTDEICEKNGWRKWSEYKDNDKRIYVGSYDAKLH